MTVTVSELVTCPLCGHCQSAEFPLHGERRGRFIHECDATDGCGQYFAVFYDVHIASDSYPIDFGEQP